MMIPLFRFSHIYWVSLALIGMTTPLFASTVAFWRFENNFLDSSGNGLHGSPVGAPTFWVTGIAGSSAGLLCDGRRDRVFVGDSPKLALTQSLTVEAFVSRSGDDGQIVFRGDNRPRRDSYTLTLSDGRVLFRIDDENDGSVEVKSPTALPSNQFVHVAGTLDGSSGILRLFVNGQEVASTATRLRPVGSLDPASRPGLGICAVQTDSQYFKGIVDEVRISDVALSPSQFLTNALLVPDSILFDFKIGGDLPQMQNLSVIRLGTYAPFTVTASGENWLSVNALNSMTPANLAVSVNPRGLSPGTYIGMITITSPGAGNSPHGIRVVLSVSEIRITTSPSSLAFTCQAGGSCQGSSARVSITASGTTLPISISASGGNWLSVSPIGPSNAPVTLSAAISPTGLMPGTYDATISIIASGAVNPVTTIPVRLTVIARTPAFTAAGVVNAASYAPGVVPGGLVTIFGQGLSVITGIEWANGAGTHKGVSVLVGEIPACPTSTISPP